MDRRKAAILSSEKTSGRDLAARRAFNRELAAGEKKRKREEEGMGSSSWACVRPYPKGSQNRYKRQGSCEPGAGPYPNRQKCMESCFSDDDDNDEGEADAEEDPVFTALLEGRVYDAFLLAREARDADRGDDTLEGALLRRDLRGALRMALEDARLEIVPYHPAGLAQLVEMGLHEEAHQSASQASTRRREAGLEAAVLRAHLTGEWEDALSEAQSRTFVISMAKLTPMEGRAEVRRANLHRQCLADGGKGFDRMLRRDLARGHVLDARDVARECGSESRSGSDTLEDLLLRGEFRAAVETLEAEGGRLKWDGLNHGMAQLVVAGLPDVAKRVAEQTNNGRFNLAIFGEQLEYALKQDNVDDARRLAREVYRSKADVDGDSDGCAIA